MTESHGTSEVLEERDGVGADAAGRQVESRQQLGIQTWAGQTHQEQVLQDMAWRWHSGAD
jgi:hypothetical protein